MAFRKGISGNPGGRSSHKIFTDALRLEVNRIDPKNPDRKKINALAETLVDRALKDRESWAFQQIASKASRARLSRPPTTGPASMNSAMPS